MYTMQVRGRVRMIRELHLAELGPVSILRVAVRTRTLRDQAPKRASIACGNPDAPVGGTEITTLPQL